MNQLLRIAITPEEITDSEPQWVTRILDRGWDMVHLRHPMASLRDMRNLIEAIPQRYHSRLRLHGHFILTNEFNLGGIHLNRRCPMPPDNYSGPYSRSCHSLEEIAASSACDYVTLSPIFDSISKIGYKAAFSHTELLRLNEITSPLVIALGGIIPERIEELTRYNFGGYAVKGAISSFISLP